METIKDRNGMHLTEADDIKNTWQRYTEKRNEKALMTQTIMRCGHSAWARHPGMQSQVGLKEHHYFKWAILNPKQWCCESAALNMTENLEN